MPEPQRQILLVDDEVVFLSSLRDGLAHRFHQHRFHVAHHGGEALDTLDRELIDLVVTDLKMPVLDGFGLLARMHRHHRGVPAIVMTAFGTASTEQQVLEAGAIHCVDKPVDLNALVAQIEAALTPAAAGRLRGVSLAAFLQLLAMERHTGAVQVRWAAGTSRLYLRDGGLVHAEDATQSGLEVALRTAALEHVEIELRTGERPMQQTINMSLQNLLLEAARLRDQQTRDVPETGLEDMDDLFGEHEPAAPDTDASPGIDARSDDAGPASPAPPATQAERNVERMLQAAMQIEGTIGVALVDGHAGITLGTMGRGLDLELAAAGMADVVRAKLRTIEHLGLSDRLEDILITLASQYHLMRIFTRQPNRFIYLALDRRHANLGMARFQLAEIERQLAS